MRATVNNSARLSKGFKVHYDPVKGAKKEERGLINPIYTCPDPSELRKF